MTSSTGAAGRTAGDFGVGAMVRRAIIETKASFNPTEFFAYLVAVTAVVITAAVVSGDGNTADPFNAEQALRYITFLTIGCMISRGLVKPVVESPTPRTANRLRWRT